MYVLLWGWDPSTTAVYDVDQILGIFPILGMSVIQIWYTVKYIDNCGNVWREERWMELRAKTPDVTVTWGGDHSPLPVSPPADGGPSESGNPLCVTHAKAQDWIDDAHTAGHPDWVDATLNNRFSKSYPSTDELIARTNGFRYLVYDKCSSMVRSVYVGYVLMERTRRDCDVSIWHLC